MKHFKTIVFLLLSLLLFSCSDDWKNEQTVKQLTKHQWELQMYIDGKANEVVSIGDMVFIFENNGVFKKYIGNNYQTTTWEITQLNYVRIGASTFKIKSLTNKILSLEYGEDTMYFLPYKTTD